jgi:hypothetical protein
MHRPDTLGSEGFDQVGHWGLSNTAPVREVCVLLTVFFFQVVGQRLSSHGREGPT